MAAAYLAYVWLLALIFQSAAALDNGLALTPPMGWLTWQRFRCNTDCVNDPDNCIGEKLMLDTAYRLAEDGYLEAGYDTIIVDDCWAEKERDGDGRLVPDHQRFPNGLRFIIDYAHSKGLKFGIYGDFGNYTCGGYPGSLGHLETDAQTFAEWGVDYLKLDGCYADVDDYAVGYPEMGQRLNETGRPIVYSCSWPAYLVGNGIQPNYSDIAEACNLWRNYDDIDDSWTSVTTIMRYYAEQQDDLIAHAGPGHWNDPDMLIIGNFGLSDEQSKVQFAIWAILASPLIMSNDLRAIADRHRDLLLNKNAIAINQDPLGIQGRRIYNDTYLELWVKPILPQQGEDSSYAVAFFKPDPYGTPSHINSSLNSLGLTSANGYEVYDIFADRLIGVLSTDEYVSLIVNPSGVALLRFNVVAPGTLSPKPYKKPDLKIRVETNDLHQTAYSFNMFEEVTSLNQYFQGLLTQRRKSLGV